jgi:ABC-type amino acid transport substrate-binding protein
MCQQTIGFLGLCAVLLASCSGFDDDSLRRIKKAGEIRIAMSSDYPPFSYYNEKKVLDGFASVSR